MTDDTRPDPEYHEHVAGDKHSHAYNGPHSHGGVSALYDTRPDKLERDGTGWLRQNLSARARLSGGTDRPDRLREALEIIAAPPTKAPDAIGVTARNIARAALSEPEP